MFISDKRCVFSSADQGECCSLPAVNSRADPASLSLLRSRLQDAHPGVAIYAMNKLEALDGQAVVSELPGLIGHPAPEVRREAFDRIERLKLKAMMSEVQNQLLAETDPAVKESALRTLGAITINNQHLILALNETDTHILRGALIGLLKNGNETAASEKLTGLLASTSSAERNLALEVLGQIRRRDMLPQLISACDSPATSRAAGLALVSIGVEALPEIETAFSQPDAPRQRLLTLAKTLGRIGGTHSKTILLSRISATDSKVRTQILSALSQSGCHMKDLPLIRSAVKAEMQQAAWVSAAQVDLGENAETALLAAALQGCLVQTRSRALLLLSFAFEAGSIRRVREALFAGSPRQVSYVLEIMDVQLPADWKPCIMPLLEDLSPLTSVMLI